MATTTPNYGLGKPLISEKYDVNVLNGNADKVDTELKKVSDRVEEIITTPAEGISAQEVIDARQGEASLGANINKLTSQLAEKPSQAALDVEKARITNLATLAVGSTTGDAELIDGRVGANAKTYANIGSAIREQVTGVKNDLSQLYIKKTNPTFVFGFVNTTGGYANSATKQYTTHSKLMYLPKGSRLTLKNTLASNLWFKVHRYGLDYKYVNDIAQLLCNAGESLTFEIPEDALYRIYVFKQYAALTTDAEQITIGQNITISVLKSDRTSVKEFEWVDARYDHLTGVNNALNSNSFVFSYQTDTHYESNDPNFQNLYHLENLVDVSNLLAHSFIANLGDVIHGYNAPEIGKTDWLKCLEIYHKAKCNYLPLIGNHDNCSAYAFSPKGSKNIEDIIRKEWLYQSTMLKATHRDYISPNIDTGYYIKDYGNVRVIVMDTIDLPETMVNAQNQLIFASIYQTGVRQKQLEWLIRALKDVQDKQVVILSHHSFADSTATTGTTSTVYNSNAVRGILKAFKEGGSYSVTQEVYGNMPINISCDFTTQGVGTIIGNFSGDIHTDQAFQVDGIWYIITDSSVSTTSLNKLNRTVGTWNDEAIDTVVVDKVLKNIKMFRYGYGVNREFNY